jgi:hypothetical protein
LLSPDFDFFKPTNHIIFVSLSLVCMKNHLLLSALAVAFLFSCSNQSTVAEKEPHITGTTDSSQIVSTSKKMASAAEIVARKQVPVLCYHHIKEVVGKNSAGYDVTIAAFKAQMKALADSGYKTITPDQYYAYLVYGNSLPEKPVMITYDDTDEEQFTIAKPEMDKRRRTGRSSFRRQAPRAVPAVERGRRDHLRHRVGRIGRQPAKARLGRATI